MLKKSYSMMDKNGILYGIGVGPGEPELMTLKALRIIRSCDVIVLPARQRKHVMHIKSHMRYVLK